MVNFKESTILQEVMKKEQIKSYGWSNYLTETCFKSLFEGMALFLGRVKSKDQAVALEIVDQDDKMHFAAIVEYHKDETTDAGAFSISYTFDENDIDDKNTKIYKFPEDNMAYTALIDITYSKWGVAFTNKEKDDNGATCEASPRELFIDCIDSLKDYMKIAVNQDPQLEFPEYFTATAEINGDSVYISIEPSAILKQHIKEDISVQEDKSIPIHINSVRISSEFKIVSYGW